MYQNILITGGAGFIGSEIVKQLNEKEGIHITVLDVMSEQIHGVDWKQSYLYQSIKDKCDFVKGDIRDLPLVEKLLEGKDCVIHLASETGTGQSMYEINHYTDVNVMGTANLLQAISNQGKNNTVKKIILSSSRSVYGEGKYSCPHCGIVYPLSRRKEKMINGDFSLYCNECGEKLNLEHTSEDSKANPSSLYAFTKYTQEKMLETMCPALNIDYTIFRFQNVYGVGQSLKNPYTGILSIFSTLMLEEKPVNIFEDGKESRDFINVVDVAQAVIASIDNELTNAEVINLGSGNGTTVIEIATMLKMAYKSKSKINVTGDFRLGDIAHNVSDVTKAKKLLNFTPSIKLQDGIQDFCKWVMNEKHEKIQYEESLEEMRKSGFYIKK